RLPADQGGAHLVVVHPAQGPASHRGPVRLQRRHVRAVRPDAGGAEPGTIPRMEHAFGLPIPRTLEEACDPRHTALLVYDMQVGIIRQIADGERVTSRVAEVLAAAREAGVRTYFTRHMSLPNRVSGIAH